MGRIAIVIGATGLVGRALTRQLLADERYDKVTVFARRSTGLPADERIVDFDELASWRDQIVGDSLFSAMGTTLKQAGGKDAQWRIDYTYQYEVARAAADNAVASYHLVSAAGAKARSMVFYNRMKGQLEEAVTQLSFARIVIYQPSLLVGTREQSRAGEGFAEVAMKAVTWLPGVRRYRAIRGDTVAAAMIARDNQAATDRVERLTLDAIHAAAEAI